MSDKKIRVLLNGCNGKMGGEVIKAIKTHDNMEIVAGVDRFDTGDNSFPVYTKITDIDIVPDVIIDFSVPIATFAILEYSKKHRIPTVIATTGFNDKELEKIGSFANDFPIFRSANMSYEVNLMAKVVAEVAEKLYDSDIEIVETHHNRKIDAPSGTALLLADSINDAMNNAYTYEYNRHAKKEKRDKKEIGIHSIRGGTECGTHEVIYFGENESFSIKHNVTSRGVFANGALKAAEFIVHKEPGKVYNMNDMM